MRVLERKHQEPHTKWSCFTGQNLGGQAAHFETLDVCRVTGNSMAPVPSVPGCSLVGRPSPPNTASQRPPRSTAPSWPPCRGDQAVLCSCPSFLCGTVVENRSGEKTQPSSHRGGRPYPHPLVFQKGSQTVLPSALQGDQGSDDHSDSYTQVHRMPAELEKLMSHRLAPWAQVQSPEQEPITDRPTRAPADQASQALSLLPSR